MYEVIGKMGLLLSYDARFYVGSILITLEYLHKRSIIYRDIKPENIMVDERGFICIIDMGSAKNLRSEISGNIFISIFFFIHFLKKKISKINNRKNFYLNRNG